MDNPAQLTIEQRRFLETLPVNKIKFRYSWLAHHAAYVGVVYANYGETTLVLSVEKDESLSRLRRWYRRVVAERPWLDKNMPARLDS